MAFITQQYCYRDIEIKQMKIASSIVKMSFITKLFQNLQKDSFSWKFCMFYFYFLDDI